jgi:hypothetical protein
VHSFLHTCSYKTTLFYNKLLLIYEAVVGALERVVSAYKSNEQNQTSLIGGRSRRLASRELKV